MDAFSDLLEDNWTHSPSWERNSPPSDSKQQIPSNTILQPHQRSLFLDFRWLYVNPNIILQWAESLRGQQGTSQSQIQCLNEFFGELKEKKKKKDLIFQSIQLHEYNGLLHMNRSGYLKSWRASEPITTWWLNMLDCSSTSGLLWVRDVLSLALGSPVFITQQWVKGGHSIEISTFPLDAPTEVWTPQWKPMVMATFSSPSFFLSQARNKLLAQLS